MREREEHEASHRGILTADALLTIASGSFVLIYKTDIHPAICISIFVALAAVLIGVYQTYIGYWIVTVVFGCIWAAIAGTAAYLISSNDMTWGVVIAIYAFILAVLLHGVFGKIKAYFRTGYRH